MCFEKKNKNFIKVKLHVNMKGLTDEERLINYEVIKDETRKRLKSAYTDCENLFSFYEEAFDYLSSYDLGFLLTNLFFEKQASNIFLYLSNGSLSNSNISHKEKFSSRLYNDMLNAFSKDLEVDFLKLEFTKLLNLNTVDWESVNTSGNEIVKKYACWLMEENKQKIQTDLNIYCYFLFCKIWNSYDTYDENFSDKASIFYNKLNLEYEKMLNEGFYVNLDLMITELKSLKDDLFIEDIGFFPLFDQEKQASKGYTIQRDKFNENIRLSKTLSKSYKNKTFVSLFNILFNAEGFLCEKLKREINNKLDRLQIPSQSNLDEIRNIKLVGENKLVKEDFFKRLYIY